MKSKRSRLAPSVPFSALDPSSGRIPRVLRNAMNRRGFYATHMGGNVLAFRRMRDGVEHLVISSDRDGDVPRKATDPVLFCVALPERGGECLATLRFPSTRALFEALDGAP